jgi:hypothetical protein
MSTLRRFDSKSQARTAFAAIVLQHCHLVKAQQVLHKLVSVLPDIFLLWY